MTKYPNLLAEYEAHGWHIIHWAERANVTKELMQEVLYNGAELTSEEIKSIGREAYISSPELTFIETSDQIIQHHLDKFMEWFNGITDVFKPYSFEKEEYKRASALVKAYMSEKLTGKPITIAIYGAAMSAKESLEYSLKPKSEPRGSKPAIKLLSLPTRSDKNMSNLQIFNNSEFGEVRFIDYNGKPYAVGVDVARMLSYAKPSQAIIDHCKGIRKLGIPSYNQHGAEVIQETNCIPEGDIYRLIVKAADQSKNLEIRLKAEKIERWIFDEVLPSIRKTGGYVPQPMSQLEILVQAAQALVEQDKAIKQLTYKQEQQEGKIQELTAKVKTIPDEYYSIAGYASLRGIKVDISRAGLLGRKATKLSKKYDIEVGKVYDPRFGQVNTYHLDVLKEVFVGREQETA